MLVEAEIEMASILLIISERYVEDERRERLKQGQKSSTQQVCMQAQVIVEHDVC